MKKILATLALAATVVLQSFAPQNNSDEKEVSITKSSVTWKGYKVTGSHTGIIALKSGSLSFEDSKLVGGGLCHGHEQYRMYRFGRGL